MTFFAGLIIGAFGGALSWVAAALWLELKRTQREWRAEAEGPAAVRIARLREHHSNAQA